MEFKIIKSKFIDDDLIELPIVNANIIECQKYRIPLRLNGLKDRM